MPSIKTEITEIVTGLATLPFSNLEEALESRPPELVNVANDHWDRLITAHKTGDYDEEFERAWANGQAFLASPDGLRKRHPIRIEWKGPHQNPGYDWIPADLRIDHVYLVSCKYRSKILFNASPWHLFDRTLAARRGDNAGDWFLHMAAPEYQALYSEVRRALGLMDFPERVEELQSDQRLVLKEHLSQSWPGNTAARYLEFCHAVARNSAEHWGNRLGTKPEREEMFWRILRLYGAPYYVLGTSGPHVMRLRVYTPWDWRREFDLLSFTVSGDQSAEQPKVLWDAQVLVRESNTQVSVSGHVEVRWSHGRFRGRPEAKVYLDTPHEEVPGYVSL